LWHLVGKESDKSDKFRFSIAKKIIYITTKALKRLGCRLGLIWARACICLSHLVSASIVLMSRGRALRLPATRIRDLVSRRRDVPRGLHYVASCKGVVDPFPHSAL
jgi:hypothetical protein